MSSSVSVIAGVIQPRPQAGMSEDDAGVTQDYSDAVCRNHQLSSSMSARSKIHNDTIGQTCSGREREKPQKREHSLHAKICSMLSVCICCLLMTPGFVVKYRERKEKTPPLDVQYREAQDDPELGPSFPWL